MSTESNSGGNGQQQPIRLPRVFRCIECKAVIEELVIASECPDCGAPIGDDRFLIDSVSKDLLLELRAESDGCLCCGDETGGEEQVFCETECSKEWFRKYTDMELIA